MATMRDGRTATPHPLDEPGNTLSGVRNRQEEGAHATTPATIDMQHVFSEVAQSGSFRPLPDNCQGETITATGWKCHGLGVQRKACEKNDRFPAIVD